jgi:hypothetical protein
MKHIQNINEFENNKDKINVNIHKVSFYDFDGTIIDSPTPEIGKLLWEKKKGMLYPYRGWWSKKESLDFTVFKLEPIEEVIKKLKKDIKNPNCWVVLLTNRMSKLENEVLDVLDTLNLHFDEIQMKKDFHSPKSIRIKNVIQNFPQVNNIDIYDDDNINIQDFIELRKELYQSGYTVEINKIHPSNVKPRIEVLKDSH